MDAVGQVGKDNGLRPRFGQKNQCRLHNGLAAGEGQILRPTERFGLGGMGLGLGCYRLKRSGNVQSTEAPRTEPTIQLNEPMTQQRLTEHAVTQEIHVLLYLDDVPSQALERFIYGCSVVAGEHRRKLSFGQILESVTLGSLDELMEVNRLVNFLQGIVAKVGVLPALHVLQLALEQQAIGIVLRIDSFRQPVNQSARLLDLLLRFVELARVIKHHIPQHAEHAPAGVGVVADVGHPLFAQALAADGKNLLLNVGGYPGINTVGDDVIERTEVLINAADVEVTQCNICETKSGDKFAAGLDLSCREVHADEAAFRQSTGHRDQVRAVGTP